MIDNTKIYKKTSEGGMWEKHTRLAIGLTMIVGTILLVFASVALSFIGIPTVISVMITFSIYIAAVVSFTWIMVQRHLRSSLMAIIRHDGKLYAVALGDTKAKLGTETDRSYIAMPSGSMAQLATLHNNVAVAKDILAHEREVREYSKQESAYTDALSDILEYLSKNPEEYSVTPSFRYSSIDRLIRCRLENNAFTTIETDKRIYGFLILNGAKIFGENRKNFDVQFLNEEGEVCTARFSNCFKEAFYE